MARADLLKQLLEGYQRRDDGQFARAATELIADERRKHHLTLADELQRILEGGRNGHSSAHELTRFEAVPVDENRRTPLLAIRRPDRLLTELVLTERTRQALDRASREFRGWDVLEANGLRPVRHLLFCGPPGCGKTAAAEALACVLGLPLLYVRFDAVVSSLLGETSANLGKIFEYAKRGQWVLLFDEFDAVGRSRDDATEHGEIKRVVNSYLQLMDGFRGRSLVIAATNFERSLDPAIWRRFDDVIRFDLPSMAQIDRLVRNALQPLKVDAANVQRLVHALAGASFSDAERVALDVRKLSALAGTRSPSDALIEEALLNWRERNRALHLAGMDQSFGGPND